MVVVGTLVLPHGAMVFDGDENSTSASCRERHKKLTAHMKESCSQLYRSCVASGDWVASLKPDLVVLHTPHGLSLTSGALCVYMSAGVEGTALWNDQWAEFKLSLPLDESCSKDLLAHVQERGHAADGLVTFSACQAPIRWGEAVPLWFIDTALSKENTDTKYLIMCQGKLPHTLDEERHLKLGATLGNFLESLDKRVVLAISGDLSHTYSHNCTDPLYLPDPRWNMPVNQEAAEAYQQAIEGWVKSVPIDRLSDDPKTPMPAAETRWLPDVSQDSLKRALSLQPTALSCGIRGFWLLHGLMACLTDTVQGFSAKFLTACAPTYYGMMVAYFIRSKPKESSI